MTLAQLRTLVAVLETGNFTGAAKVLKITQSGVSHAVAGLERELGVPLVERGRKVSLTEAGQRILVHVRDLLAQEEHIRQEGRATPGVVAGRVRLGSLPSVSARLLPEMLASLSRRYPGIDVALFEGTDDEVRDWLRTGAIDVGVVTLPSKDFDTGELLADEMLVVLPETHRLARKPTVRLREIAAEPFIMSKGGCEPLIRHMYRSARVTLRIRYEVRETSTILGMVKEGLGVTVVPSLSLPAVRPGISTLMVQPAVTRTLALGVRSLAASAPATKAFVREAQHWARSRGLAGIGRKR